MKILLKNCKTVEGLQKIIIEDDKIVEIISSATEMRFKPECDKIIDIGGNFVIPGVIDPHVHVRDLKQAYKEDWNSVSKAALSGGVTTIFDMPNSVPATVNLANLNIKREAAKKAFVNYKFYLGATNSNLNELEEILKTNPNDIAGIKVFLSASSSNEIINSRNNLRAVFQLAKKFDKVVVVHTELQEIIDFRSQKIEEKNILKHGLIRDRFAAIKGTKLVLDLANEIKNKLYIAHVSTKEEIELIKVFKDDNRIFCEVTPHHLLLNEMVLKNVGNFGKVNPPLRTENDNKALWKAILDGTADVVGTDHAPHSKEEKEKEYSQAPSGFPGLETGLHLLLNEVNKGNLSMKRLIELTSKNPAKIFELENRGEIKIGNYADLTVIDMKKKWKIDSSKFHSKAKYSPFDGFEIQGKVLMTFVNGRGFVLATNKTNKTNKGKI
ncbi:MAG: hypothetical protein DRZ79_03965 [Candidatus Cloacimonadota bacterium]|nr:MAG: hypothetical protein DRZ79_03965 [Candidatus Cloacimonadota bacterium]